MNNINVAIVNTSTNPLPSYETLGSAGVDLRANYMFDGVAICMIVEPGQTVLVPTGLYVAIPLGYEWEIRSRSGLALKNNVIVLNAPGTIDSDYRGEVKIILKNDGEESFIINHGDRVAQAVLDRVDQANFIPLLGVDLLPSTERSTGGFGSTGVK